MNRDPKHTALRALVAAALFALLAAPAAAQVPDVLPYQGYLTNDAGMPQDQEVSLTFRLYADGDSPSALWTETWDVIPEGGVFYVYLGMIESLAGVMGSGEVRYLGVSVGDEGEATPRQRVGSVPYAMMANSAISIGGLTVDDFATQADLAGYARWDVLGERGYVTVANLDERGYATEQWVRDQAYLTEDDIADIDVDLTGYATEQWVRDQGYTDEEWVRGYVGEQGYLGAAALDGYATEQWVRDQGYTDQDWVRGYVGEQGYLGAAALDGYATEQWVRDQGYTDQDWVRGYVGEQLGGLEYPSEDWVRTYVGEQGYVRADALEAYATEEWVMGYVGEQGYLRADALNGYATEQWVRDQGYLTGAALNGYATEQWVRDQGYVTDAALDARGYATVAYVDTLRADVSRTYVTNAALDARGFITAAALADYATTAGVEAADAALDARITAIEEALGRLGGAFLLGRSNQTSNGRFSFNGQTGMRAANEMCRSTYPNEPTAHFCSPDEVFRAVSTGAMTANARVAADSLWTWTVSHESDTNNRNNNSLHGNCQNLMYNSGDASDGTRIMIDFDYRSAGNGGGITGDVVRLGRNVGCGTTSPVLCCR